MGVILLILAPLSNAARILGRRVRTAGIEETIGVVRLDGGSNKADEEVGWVARSRWKNLHALLLDQRLHLS